MSTGKRNSAVFRRWVLVSLLALYAVPIASMAQTTISGRIIGAKDDTPIPGAFVYVYEGSSMVGYALSDENGAFVVDIPRSKSADKITATCLGYRTETLILEGHVPPYVLVMTEQAISIRESKVTSSAIEEKGDTLVFTARAFADGSERVLGDLLEKIPGLSVTKSGGIRYDGDYINKFYVEGLDLMGSRYGLVTKNLSPEMVSRIEVYKNHQPMKALVGISETDKSAVNIILKDSAKNTWMMTGDALAGVPPFPLFDTKLLVTRFSKQGQDFYLAKGNNIGEDILQELWQQQYFGRTGAFLISNDDLDVDFQTRLNPSRESLPLPQSYWYDNLSGIGSFNHLTRIDEDKQLRISAQLAAEEYNESSLSSEIINFGSGQSMSIIEDFSSEDIKYFASGKISYENNSTRRFVRNDLSFSGQIRKNSGAINGGNNNGTELYNLPSLKVSNDLDITFRSSSRRAITFESITKYVRNNHSGDYLTDAFNAHQLFEQNEFISENGISYGLSAFGIRFSFDCGVDLEYQGLTSELTGLDDSRIKSRASLGLFSISPKANTELQLFVGKSDIRLSLPVKMNVVSGKGLSRTVIYPSFSPSTTIERNITPSLKADARISFDARKSDIENFLPCAVMSNYRGVSYADSLSSRSSFLSILSLKYSDNISMFYASLSSSVYLNRAERTSSSQYSELVTITSYKDLEAKSNNYGVSGSISKFFGTKTFVAELIGGWERSNNDLYLQSLFKSYCTDSFNTTLNIRLSPTPWFSMEANTEWKNAKISGSTSSESNSIIASGTLSLTPYKPLSIITSANYRYESIPNMSISNNPLLKLSVSWQFKRMSLVAECRNILGCSEFTRKYVNEYQTVSTTTKLKGRQYLFGIRMSL